MAMEWAHWAKLSDAETMVLLAVVALGHAEKNAVAAKIDRAPDTVKAHFRAILVKTGTPNMDRLIIHIAFELLAELLT